jgi:tetratricopeptide (TPR) repeat protein
LRFSLALSVVAAVVAGCGSYSKSATSAADRLVNEGLRAQQQGNAALALQDYQAAIKANPLDKYAYYDLGVVYQQGNDVANAASAYQKALLIDPKYKSALFNLAVLDTPSSPGTAVALYEQLDSFDPNDPNVLLNLGLLLRQLGDTQQGQADLTRAVQLNPALASRIPQVDASPSTTAPPPVATTRPRP